jgi:hypothetical protein
MAAGRDGGVQASGVSQGPLTWRGAPGRSGDTGSGPATPCPASTAAAGIGKDRQADTAAAPVIVLV